MNQILCKMRIHSTRFSILSYESKRYINKLDTSSMKFSLKLKTENYYSALMDAAAQIYQYSYYVDSISLTL